MMGWWGWLVDQSVLALPVFTVHNDGMVRVVAQCVLPSPWGGGGVTSSIVQLFGSQVQHAKIILDLIGFKFCENEGWNRFKINEKGVNWIENQGENLYKMLKIC